MSENTKNKLNLKALAWKSVTELQELDATQELSASPDIAPTEWVPDIASTEWTPDITPVEWADTWESKDKDSKENSDQNIENSSELSEEEANQEIPKKKISISHIKNNTTQDAPVIEKTDTTIKEETIEKVSPTSDVEKLETKKETEANENEEEDNQEIPKKKISFAGIMKHDTPKENEEIELNEEISDTTEKSWEKISQWDAENILKIEWNEDENIIASLWDVSGEKNDVASNDIETDTKKETEIKLKEENKNDEGEKEEKQVEEDWWDKPEVKKIVSKEKVQAEKKPWNKISILDQIIRRKEERLEENAAQEKREEAQATALENKKEEKRGDPAKEVKFINYESGFQRKSVNLIKRIQNFKYTPKTRTWLVLWLITLCIGTISVLMIFFPENHSFSIYKASILEMYNGWEAIDTSIVPTPIPVDVPETVTQDNLNNGESGSGSEELSGSWETSDILWNADFSDNSNNTEFTGKEKLKNFLLEKYTDSLQ